VPVTDTFFPIVSPPPTSVTQSPGLKWRCQAVESDVDSDTDPTYKSNIEAISTPPISHILPFTVVKGTPTQSEATTMTSWDEWDGPEGMLCNIDPIMIMSEGDRCKYQSLL
jgi:hypothetical protein